MANRYWNPAAAANWNVTSSWAEVDGGATGFSVPTSSDNVFFTSTNNNNCTINVTSNCADINFGDYSGTLGGSNQLNCYGSFVLSSTMTRSWTGNLAFMATTTGNIINLNRKTLQSGSLYFSGSGEYTLTNDFTNSSSPIYFQKGTFNTGNYNITCGDIYYKGPSL